MVAHPLRDLINPVDLLTTDRYPSNFAEPGGSVRENLNHPVEAISRSCARESLAICWNGVWSGLESAPAGSRLHAVADEGIPFRDIAAAIGRGAGVPVAGISAEDAGERFAFLGAVVGVDNPTSSEVTRKVLGWEPAHPGLLEDLEHGHYFEQG